MARGADERSEMMKSFWNVLVSLPSSLGWGPFRELALQLRGQGRFGNPNDSHALQQTERMGRIWDYTMGCSHSAACF